MKFDRVLHLIDICMIVSIALVIAAWCVAHSDTLRTKVATFVAKLRGAVRSKTMWFNAMMLLTMDRLPDILNFLAQNLPMVQPMLPTNHYAFILEMVAVGNLILRFKTSNPLEAK